MKRRAFIASTLASLALVPLRVFAGKGWCRSEPIVRLDGKMYSITGFADAKKATFAYLIEGPFTSQELIMAKPTDSVVFSWANRLSFSVKAYDENGDEVAAYVQVVEIGS